MEKALVSPDVWNRPWDAMGVRRCGQIDTPTGYQICRSVRGCFPPSAICRTRWAGTLSRGRWCGSPMRNLKPTLIVNAFQEPVGGDFSSHSLRFGLPINGGSQCVELNARSNVVNEAGDLLR